MKSDIRSYLRQVDFPDEDDYERQTSQARFADGSQFKTELLPTTADAYREIFDLVAESGVEINKFVDVTGTVFDTDDEIREKCRLCREAGVQLLMEPGRGHDASDISQQMALGAMPGGTIRGVDTLVDTLTEIKRASELGCRGFNLQDEGVLKLGLQMREDGFLPADTIFKVSSAFSVSNPASLSFWANHLGSHDSINPSRDLTLPMIAALRQTTDQPIDLHAFWHMDVVRIHDMPEIVRVAAPVSIKNYRVTDPGVEAIPLAEQFKQTRRVVEVITQEYPEATQAALDPDLPGVPGEPER